MPRFPPEKFWDPLFVEEARQDPRSDGTLRRRSESQTFVGQMLESPLEMTWRRTAPSRFPAGCLIFAALTAGALSLTAGADPPGRIHLKVLHERYLSFAPIAIAQAEGYFRAQGLDVEWVVHLTGSSETTPALIQGELDVVVGMLRIGDFNAICPGRPDPHRRRQGPLRGGPCIASAFVARRAFVEARTPRPSGASPRRARGGPAARLPGVPSRDSCWVAWG